MLADWWRGDKQSTSAWPCIEMFIWHSQLFRDGQLSMVTPGGRGSPPPPPLPPAPSYSLQRIQFRDLGQGCLLLYPVAFWLISTTAVNKFNLLNIILFLIFFVIVEYLENVRIWTVPVVGNTIVTYYGFTILDLVRLQEGEQYREQSL